MVKAFGDFLWGKQHLRRDCRRSLSPLTEDTKQFLEEGAHVPTPIEPRHLRALRNTLVLCPRAGTPERPHVMHHGHQSPWMH
jgi:hypothetical protein